MPKYKPTPEESATYRKIKAREAGKSPRTDALAKRLLKSIETAQRKNPEDTFGDTIDFDRLMARILESHDLQADARSPEVLPEVRQLHVEWTLDIFASRKVRPYLQEALKMYDRLVAASLQFENYYDYQDLNNKIYFIPAPDQKVDPFIDPEQKYSLKRKVFAIHTQNFNYLFILEENINKTYDFHIRRFYDVYEMEDKWDKKEDQKFRDGGILYAIRQAKTLERYADDVLDNQYPERPSLDYFRKTDFQPRYGDSRDVGYIMTWSHSSFREKHIDYSLNSIGAMSRALTTLSYAPQNFVEDDE